MQNPRSAWSGIASFVCWLLSAIFTCTLFTTAFLPYITNSTASLPPQMQSTLITFLGAGSCLLTPAALILGIIGIFKKKSVKTFGVVGALGAGLTLLCILVPLMTWAVLTIRI